MSVAGKLVSLSLSSVGLLSVWLVLARSTTLGQLLLGLALALAVPLLTSRLRATAVRVRRPGVAVRFVLRVGCDVVLANFVVAWGVIIWRWRRPDSRFVTVPLDLRDPIGLAVLAMVTTIVPGTVWSELALDRSALLLHGWDVGEEGAFIARFKDRYERPLMEIFE